MTQKERVSEALDAFLKNEHWKAYYETAPSDLCKEYISYEFARSKFHVDADLESERALEAKLSKEDWEHLIKYAGSGIAKNALRQKMKDHGAGNRKCNSIHTG